MSLPDTQFLNQWVRLCIDAVGRELPVNYIDEQSIGFKLRDDEEPLATTDGKFTRFVVLTHGKVDPNG
jgi:hypothetical protein